MAVIISPIPCAVDIESISRNFERVAPRYIAPQESHLASPQSLPTLWSIKECLYKYSGVKGITLLEDIRVMEIEQEHFIGSVTPHNITIHGCVESLLDHVLVYIG